MYEIFICHFSVCLCPFRYAAKYSAMRPPWPSISWPTAMNGSMCVVCVRKRSKDKTICEFEVLSFLSLNFENDLCPFCSNGHMLTHRNKKPYECKAEGCGKSYCDARSLRRHTENHHSALAMTPTTPNQPTTGPPCGLSLSPATASGEFFPLTISHTSTTFDIKHFLCLNLIFRWCQLTARHRLCSILLVKRRQFQIAIAQFAGWCWQRGPHQTTTGLDQPNHAANQTGQRRYSNNASTKRCATTTNMEHAGEHQKFNTIEWFGDGE
jgi:hypothetical protein